VTTEADVQSSHYQNYQIRETDTNTVNSNVMSTSADAYELNSGFSTGFDIAANANTVGLSSNGYQSYTSYGTGQSFVETDEQRKTTFSNMDRIGNIHTGIGKTSVYSSSSSQEIYHQ
jgi:hypothetical protein